MDIQCELRNNVGILRSIGGIDDIGKAERLHDAACALRTQAKALALDLRRTTRIVSCGYARIIQIQDLFNQKFVVFGASRGLMDAFELLGMKSFLKLACSEAEAIALLANEKKEREKVYRFAIIATPEDVRNSLCPLCKGKASGSPGPKIFALDGASSAWLACGDCAKKHDPQLFEFFTSQQRQKVKISRKPSLLAKALGALF